MACGSFWIGVVLGWAALFAGGSSLMARLTQLGWIATLILFALIAPEPRLAGFGVLAGLVAHLLWLMRLRETCA